jgi:CxxC motif-containing protein
MKMGKTGKKKKKAKTPVVFTGPTKRYTCLTCPNCCALTTDGTQVSGNKCEKGRTFACQEWIEPLRVITTTIRVDAADGPHIVPVKTASPIPLTSLPLIMQKIKFLHLKEVPPLGTKITVKELPDPLEIVVTG